MSLQTQNDLIRIYLQQWPTTLEYQNKIITLWNYWYNITKQLYRKKIQYKYNIDYRSKIQKNNNDNLESSYVELYFNEKEFIQLAYKYDKKNNPMKQSIRLQECFKYHLEILGLSKSLAEYYRPAVYEKGWTYYIELCNIRWKSKDDKSNWKSLPDINIFDITEKNELIKLYGNYIVMSEKIPTDTKVTEISINPNQTQSWFQLFINHETELLKAVTSGHVISFKKI